MLIKKDFGYCEYDFEVDYVHIYNLFVYPNHRRQGKAKELLQLAIEAIRKTGYKEKIKIVAQPKDDCINIEKLIKFYESMELEVFTYYG